MAKRNGRRSRRQRAKSGILNVGNKMFPVAKALATFVPFIEQISAKHRQSMGSSFTNAPTTQKLKILSNIVTGSITGINLFKDEFQAPQTLNPAGVLNKWTNASLIGILYGVVGKQVNKMVGSTVLPATGKIKSVSKNALISGAIGGFFDDPLSTPNTGVQTGTRSLSPQLRLSSIRSSGGSDSTEGSL